MEEVAWTLKTMHPTRHVGFMSAAQLRQMEEEAAKTADVSADRDESDQLAANRIARR